VDFGSPSPAREDWVDFGSPSPAREAATRIIRILYLERIENYYYKNYYQFCLHQCLNRGKEKVACDVCKSVVAQKCLAEHKRSLKGLTESHHVDSTGMPSAFGERESVVYWYSFSNPNPCLLVRKLNLLS